MSPVDSTRLESDATFDRGARTRLKNLTVSRQQSIERYRLLSEQKDDSRQINQSLRISFNAPKGGKIAQSLRDSYSIALSLSQKTQPKLTMRQVMYEKVGK